MNPQPVQQFRPKPQKPQSDDCQIEITNTNKGKRIRFKGRCSKEQIQIFARENNISLDKIED